MPLFQRCYSGNRVASTTSKNKPIQLGQKNIDREHFYIKNLFTNLVKIA